MSYQKYQRPPTLVRFFHDSQLGFIRKSPNNALSSKTELTLMICGLLQYADGVAIVFDLSRPETFEGALSWLSDVTQKLFDEKRELAAAEAAHAASTRLNCSAEDSLKVA